MLYDLECYLNDVDIQLILEFKDIFGKYHPVFPKNPKGFFGRHPEYKHIQVCSMETD